MFRFLLVASAFIACAYGASLSNDAYATAKSASDIRPDGSYSNNYETSNGIAAQEQGVGGYSASGGYSYYSPEGQLIQVSYVADENGFQPSGAHLPTPPPIPAAILKSLEYIRTHPQYDEAAHQSRNVQQFQQPRQYQQRPDSRRFSNQRKLVG
ncbi:pupal cuticle protein Edg-78E [Drosophila grimshawi]|uniref:GH15388 n=1 Tax=Drosophila grimshawi TaxID=7222 RepID=B4J354_DROGR|nr:pupal cuticle protein Edg-78E [Drosophila grimshawi]EDV96125.1 GH15388 [Drosophila grimshawi]